MDNVSDNKIVCSLLALIFNIILL